MTEKDQAALDPEVANEGLCPNITTDKFTICAKTVRIKPLTVQNQLRFIKHLNSMMKGAAYYIGEEQWANVIAEVTSQPEILPELVLIMTENDNAGLSLDDILAQSEVDLISMLELVVKLAEKNQKIGKPVLDFFSEAWPLIKESISLRAQLGLKTIQEEIKLSHTTLSSLSAKGTASSRMKLPAA